MRSSAWLFLLLLLSCGQAEKTQQKQDSSVDTMTTILVGTYTKKEGHVDGKADGLYTFQFNPENGQLSKTGLTEGLINPSYLAISPDQKNVYVVNETGGEVDSTAYISAFSLNASNDSLRKLNQQPTYSFAPCYTSLDRGGQFVFVANYVGGIAAVYPRLEDGSMGEATDTLQLVGSGPHPEQEASHPHAILPSPDGRYVYVPDKGADKVWIFNYKKGTLDPASQPFVEVAAGSGPRHLVFHPQKKRAYLVNELNATVSAFKYDPQDGALELLQTIATLPEAYSGFNAGADIHLTPDGRFLYASNRGHDSIVIYEVEADGRLKLIGHEPTRGTFPRNFMIHRSGRWLLVANQNTDNIVVFEIDQKSGNLQYTSTVECKTPVCLKEL